MLLSLVLLPYFLPPPTPTKYSHPDSPWNLHHWCNERILLCGYSYYYSIWIATESLKVIIWDWCWFKWDQNLTGTSLWKSSWEKGFASCCLLAMLQSWGFSQALASCAAPAESECALQWSGKPFSDGGYFLITSLAPAPLQSNGLSKQSCFFEVFPVLLFPWVIFLQ